MHGALALINHAYRIVARLLLDILDVLPGYAAARVWESFLSIEPRSLVVDKWQRFTTLMKKAIIYFMDLVFPFISPRSWDGFGKFHTQAVRSTRQFCIGAVSELRASKVPFSTYITTWYLLLHACNTEGMFGDRTPPIPCLREGQRPIVYGPLAMCEVRIPFRATLEPPPPQRREGERPPIALVPQ